MEAVEDVVATALSRGCDYVAITDHVNRDYQVIGYDNPQINMSAYVAAMQDFKRRFNKKGFRLAMGAELGYLKSANNLYIKDLADIDFDVIINSVHCVLGSEVYYAEYFNKCPYKHFAYLEYLKAVRESVDAPYPYDIIGHIGYIQRNAPYKEPDMFYEEFSDVFDDILTAIIEKISAWKSTAKLIAAENHKRVFFATPVNPRRRRPETILRTRRKENFFRQRRTPHQQHRL